MGIENIFVWYQEKIGTYDKQLWETRIEQREQRHYGLNHIQMRSGKPDTELIDLDLVRGSSFTKAKPQHGFVKVTRMATSRWLFMPFYAKWWMRQTSAKFFTFILFLYLVQMLNIVSYFYIYTSSSQSVIENISCMEVVVPIIMAWLLSLVHSQIVATSPDKQEKRRRTRKKLKFADDIDKTGKTRRFFDSHKYRLNISICFKKPNIDDDGFESLVGNGSRTSEEEEEASSEKHEPVKKDASKSVETSTPIRDKPTEFVAEDIFIEFEPVTEQGATCVHCKRGSQDQSLEGEENSSNCASCLKCRNWVKQLNDTVTKKLCSTDSESEEKEVFTFKKPSVKKRRTSATQTLPKISVTSALDSTCDTENEALLSPPDWTAGVTTNSEGCSTDLDDVSDAASPERCSDCFLLDPDANPSSVKASCIIYERDEIKKADLSMLDISSIIISKVEAVSSSSDYFYAGMVVAMVLALLRLMCRLTEGGTAVLTFWETCKNGSHRVAVSGFATDAVYVIVDELPRRFGELVVVALGTSPWERYIVAMAMMQRFIFASMVFFLLVVAERTFKQRLLYAKLFSHLTSSRRARKSEIPHFRLNKVRNIKTWLSVRSYLKKRGPQRSVDVIVSTAFVVTLLLLAFLCAELLKDTVSFSQYYLEALVWTLGLGVMLLRFITLGTKINEKYRNLSVLITEQINLHLQIEQKPHKKDELTVANNVLKLAIDLLKELENPFKISGFCANPILYNIIKLVILSALSGVLSEILGFKLKLHKIKFK
ncbi:protein phtf isoform X2 [Euwallacea similis]|uniref:protein phtf isoform X2 n=1 Tax=Euwallacea similis TaxID=1736056 RepID=UPI00344CB78F